VTKHEDVIRQIEAMEPGPQVGAFFDFDGTLISGFSALVFLREQLLAGHMSASDLAEVVATMAGLALGRIEFSAAMAVSARILRGVSEESYRRFGKEVYQKHLASLVYPEARALVRAHQQKGHTVAIASSATAYQVGAAARDLRIRHILCTQLEVARGRFTGKVLGPTCWGRGKVSAAEAFAVQAGVDLGRSVFYSDSHDDLELLERVAHPRALNPDSKLEGVARERSWPIVRFTSRSSPDMWLYLRTLGVYGSLLGAALLGLGVWRLSGSKNDGRNAMISLWADVASALIGLKMEVTGEENLWRNRPAVVITNHQSQADAVVVMKLLRGNFAAVGKKEITDIPLISQAIQFAGVIPIDRKDASKAIESMKPLLHALHSEGRFVVVAVEGTRSISTIPGPFKKGAFHIAMQAGVPIIPIVIHNTIDVQPKGEFVFRPATVRVEVLEPVDTSQWKVEDLDEHVAAVRNLYLRKLGHPEEAAASRAVPTAVAARRRRRAAAESRAAARKSARKARHVR
jgi:putative phosphoserine phosphatase/1-acylglycerol-3-phosphate O-acyltransferase